MVPVACILPRMLPTDVHRVRLLHIVVALCSLTTVVSSCARETVPKEVCRGCPLSAERLFPIDADAVDRHVACHFASPVAYDGADGLEILLSVSDAIVAVDPLTGARKWSVTLPAPDGEMAFVVATPLLLEDSLVVGYHTTSWSDENRDVVATRHRQRVAVVDLASHALDPTFAAFDLSGEAPTADGGAQVPFDPLNALGRGAIIGGRAPGDLLGKAYVTFGNARDIQPWHGFAFEIDLDAWKSDGPSAAISGFLVTTPEIDCGTPGTSGSRQRICGGGLWSPSGPLLLANDDGFELILAAGNGQLDLARHDYANTLLRVGPGLDFDPGCDPGACADFDSDAPSLSCVESCTRLHVPRMPEGEEFSSLVSGGRCEGLTLFECWETLDYIGGSTPAHVSLEGFELLVYPTKDGAVYLVDADHLGTQYARRQLVAVCGTESATCRWDWAGMIVTKPTVTHAIGGPLAIIPTFMPDTAQEAGVFALRVVLREGVPTLEEAWRWPPAGSSDAKSRFRVHPSRVALTTIEGREIALVVEPMDAGEGLGRLIALEVETGQLLMDAPLVGRGYRFLLPLVVGDRIYVPSCESNAGDSWLEGYRLSLEPSLDEG
jgi:hypothetical protein